MAPVFSLSVRRRTWIVAPAEQKAPKSATPAPTAAGELHPVPVARRLEMRREHDENAEKADPDRRPAVDADRLLEHDGGEHDDDQRCGVADRDGVVQRQVRQGEEAREHAAAANQPAQDVALDVPRADGIDEVALPPEPDEKRHEGKGGAEEDKFAGRVVGADDLQSRRHQREGEGRKDLQEDAEDRLLLGRHGGATGSSDHASAAKGSANAGRFPCVPCMKAAAARGGRGSYGT